MRVCKKCEGKQISIHAPRVGSDADALREQYAERIISIHAPRVGSDFIQESVSLRNFSISIHAPRVGSDDFLTVKYNKAEKFQSTLPVWGATWPEQMSALKDEISIHAPRVGSDLTFLSSV